MQRVIPLKNCVSSPSILNNVMTLWSSDNLMATKKFKRRIKKFIKHGFRVYIYLSADDSKHFKRNHHVLLLSDFEETSPGLGYISVPFDPTFCLVTTSPNEVKSEAYLKNADDIIKLIGLDGAPYVNGGLNDNAGDAQKEIRETVHEIQRPSRSPTTVCSHEWL